MFCWLDTEVWGISTRRTNKKGLTFDGKTLDSAEDLFFYLPGFRIIFLPTLIYYPVQTPVYNEIETEMVKKYNIMILGYSVHKCFV